MGSIYPLNQGRWVAEPLCGRGRSSGGMPCLPDPYASWDPWCLPSAIVGAVVEGRMRLPPVEELGVCSSEKEGEGG